MAIRRIELDDGQAFGIEADNFQETIENVAKMAMRDVGGKKALNGALMGLFEAIKPMLETVKAVAEGCTAKGIEPMLPLDSDVLAGCNNIIVGMAVVSQLMVMDAMDDDSKGDAFQGKTPKFEFADASDLMGKHGKSKLN